MRRTSLQWVPIFLDVRLVILNSMLHSDISIFKQNSLSFNFTSQSNFCEGAWNSKRKEYINLFWPHPIADSNNFNVKYVHNIVGIFGKNIQFISWKCYLHAYYLKKKILLLLSLVHCRSNNNSSPLRKLRSSCYYWALAPAIKWNPLCWWHLTHYSCIHSYSPWRWRHFSHLFQQVRILRRQRDSWLRLFHLRFRNYDDVNYSSRYFHDQTGEQNDKKKSISRSKLMRIQAY